MQDARGVKYSNTSSLIFFGVNGTFELSSQQQEEIKIILKKTCCWFLMGKTTQVNDFNFTVYYKMECINSLDMCSTTINHEHIKHTNRKRLYGYHN